MDPGHQLLDVAVFDHEPVVTVSILGFLETVRSVHGEEFDHLRLHLLESLSGGRFEADTGMAGTGHPRSALQCDRGGG